MQFKTTPASTLYVKASVVCSPYSNTPRAIRIVAGDHAAVTVNNATHYVELPLHTTNEQKLDAAVDKLKQLSNAARVEYKIAPQVVKLMEKAA
jgi:hypothetical protein